MIYGDPYKIALQFDIVKEWNLEGSSWVNGIFSVYINGDPFLFTADNSTLNVWYYYYYSIVYNESFKSDSGIITKSKDYYDCFYKQIFDNFYGDEEYTFLPSEKRKGVFNITVDCLSENKKYIFIILGQDDVILYGGRSKGNYIVLPQGSFINLIKDMHNYPLFSFKKEIHWEDNYHYYANHEY